MPKQQPVATLIGDVVASRAADDRGGLHDALSAAIEETNRSLDPLVPLRITVGDEYQGCFGTVGAALRAALRLRLTLHPSADVRHGVGWGSVVVLSDEPRVEDGPGWWAARTAVEAVHAAQSRAASRGLRTAYRPAEGVDGPAAAAINAALIARDELLARVGAPSMSVLSGMLAGMSQQQIAHQLDVSPSAVSQRVRRDGLAAVVTVDELLADL